MLGTAAAAMGLDASLLRDERRIKATAGRFGSAAAHKWRADAFEALVCAAFLERGFQAAVSMIEGALYPMVAAQRSVHHAAPDACAGFEAEGASPLKVVGSSRHTWREVTDGSGDQKGDSCLASSTTTTPRDGNRREQSHPRA
eukprot:5030790-Prymnesium_polylepis.1